MDVWCFWAGIRKSSRDINDLILERSQDKAYLDDVALQDYMRTKIT